MLHFIPMRISKCTYDFPGSMNEDKKEVMFAEMEFEYVAHDYDKYLFLAGFK